MKKLIGPKRAKLFIVSAPSGCGKTTLCNRLLDEMPLLENSVSMTTRPPRPGEKKGADYHFVSDKFFRLMAKKGGFLEYEENFGHLYGTPRKFVEDNLKKGRHVLLSIDVKGAMKVERAFPRESVLVFILPPSISALKKRLRLRNSDDGKEIRRRMGLARKELSYKTRYDYRIVNDRLDRAYRKLKSIVTSYI
jgi:guanylate kinase